MADDKLWGGRFREDTSALVERFTESVSFDRRLAPYDIAGSQAHARMLAARGIITQDEARSICEGLEAILADIEAGRFVFDASREDVHMNIEAELTARIGEAGKKLHTARSRNDQVATDLRLYVRAQIGCVRVALKALMEVLVSRAEEWVDVIVPGMTHLQHAQPVSLAHHFLAYFEMFLRDYSRLGDACVRVNVSPLGAAALAGTPHAIDRFATAEALGFDHPCRNSIDAVSDRDFAVETVFCCAMVMLHLSRLCEEIILWNSQEFAFVELPDAFCTGSSIMPQKKNPDVAELVRGKVGRVYGDLMNLLVSLKALPLSYNRDMQEDKPPVFDSLDTVQACLQVMTGLVGGMKINAPAMASMVRRGFLTATDLADYLVEKGVPFRDAHRITGELVASLVEQGRDIEDLGLDELKRFSGVFAADVLERVRPAASVDRRLSYGGTARERVRAALAQARELLAGSAG